VVATANTAVKLKKRKPLHTEEQRQELISSLSMVDLCIVGHEGDIFKTVEKVRPDIIALGYDQVHQEKFIIDGCKNLNLEVRVARLQSPIPEFSSSKIEKEYGEALHGL
jgi:glycerol-3-phosphate cytidylyltransferase-like family protein